MKLRGFLYCITFTAFSMAPIVSFDAIADDVVAQCNAYSTNSYENDWLSYAAYRDAKCNGFLTKMDTYSDAEQQYWLNPYQSYFVEATDANTYGIDNSDFAMVCTHGGTWTSPDRFSLAMYNQGIRAFSNDMRLGDDGRGLSVFLVAACQTMAVHGTSNSTQWRTRWWPVFNGGLRFATGFWESTYSNHAAAATEGSNFAECIHGNGSYLYSCWSQVMLNSYMYNTPIEMTAGTDYENAYYKMFNTSMTNYYKMGRLRDSCANYLGYAYTPNGNVPYPTSSNVGFDSLSLNAVKNYLVKEGQGRSSLMDEMKSDLLGINSKINIFGEVKHDKHIDSFGNDLWQIMVYNSGDQASFVNRQIQGNYPLKSASLFSRTSNADNNVLEQKMITIAQDYFDSNIKKYLAYHDYDDIYVANVSPIVFGGSYKGSDNTDEFIVGYQVVFGREVDGIPVVGSGSNVRVELTPDGNVYSFSFDWPEIVPSTTTKLISKKTYVDRKKELFDASITKIAFEQCGLFDPGSIIRADESVNSLQVACYIGTDSLADESHNAFVVPLVESDHIIVHSGWPETYLFTNQEVPVTSSAVIKDDK